MSTLRFTRDDKTNDVTFFATGKNKVQRITLHLADFALALMAGKEVECTMHSIDTIPVKFKNKGKRKK